MFWTRKADASCLLIKPESLESSLGGKDGVDANVL